MIAERVGVVEWTIYYWRRKVKEGRCRCTGADSCAKRRFGEIPRLDLSRLGKRGSDPFV